MGATAFMVLVVLGILGFVCGEGSLALSVARNDSPRRSEATSG